MHAALLSDRVAVTPDPATGRGLLTWRSDFGGRRYPVGAVGAPFDPARGLPTLRAGFDALPQPPTPMPDPCRFPSALDRPHAGRDWVAPAPQSAVWLARLLGLALALGLAALVALSR